MNDDRLTLPRSLLDAGALHLPGLIADQVDQRLQDAFEAMAANQPGARPSVSMLADCIAIETVRAQAAYWLGNTTRVVRLLLLDKRDGANWSLSWHQDRTIAVRGRREVPGFGPWTMKRGILHVAPPADLHARMLTARLHLDAVDEENGPLLVAPGSHRLGRTAENAVEAVVARCGVMTCLAAAGDTWFYATPILHASKRAASGRRRRVVQIDLAAFDLPGGLEWAS